MQFVADFADGAVLLPVAAVVALLMAVAGWWRGLLAWAVAFAGTSATVLLLKAGALALGEPVFVPGAAARAFSPSGHVAGASVVYGGLAVLLLRGRVPNWVVALPPVAVAAVMAACRLGLGVHDGVEVVIGATVGLAGVATLAALAGQRPRVMAGPAMALTACAAFAFHGLHLHSEEALHHAFALP